ncbi:NAD(P)/FAD-dependent oxidoreductase [Candidatus Cytomitobacter indipagum]|nr:NAD(P)/FAD-dependent oxidoreductase [Candidatus Cytomitobacter indipagum]
MEKITESDVVVIGSGPSGLFSVFMLGQVGLKCTLIDSRSQIGGQCTALYPDKYIYDVAGFQEIYAQELIDRLYNQMIQYSPNILLETKISNIEKDGDHFMVRYNESCIRTRAIIIASGAGSFAPKKPDLPNIDLYNNVFYKLENPAQFTGNIAVVGGGDSAVDWCLSLANHANKVFLIHRRNKFRAMDGSLDKLHEICKTGKCEILTPYTLDSLNECDQYIIRNLNIAHKDTKEKKVIDIDTLIPCYGLQSNNDLLYNIGVDLYGSKVKIDPATAKTSCEGIYAVGDSSYYTNRHNLIVCGFSEAALASLHIRKNVFSESPYVKPPYTV